MKLAELYDRNAAYWDSRLYRAAYYGAYSRLFPTLQSEGVLDQPVRVLDCGIGAGLLSEALLHLAGRQVELHGIDLSSTLLAMSAAKFDGQGVRARPALGDIRRLPYRDEHMDLVISGLVLEHVAQPVDAVREMTGLCPESPVFLRKRTPGRKCNSSLSRERHGIPRPMRAHR